MEKRIGVFFLALTMLAWCRIVCCLLLTCGWYNIDTESFLVDSERFGMQMYFGQNVAIFELSPWCSHFFYFSTDDSSILSIHLVVVVFVHIDIFLPHTVMCISLDNGNALCTLLVSNPYCSFATRKLCRPFYPCRHHRQWWTPWRSRHPPTSSKNPSQAKNYGNTPRGIVPPNQWRNGPSSNKCGRRILPGLKSSMKYRWRYWRRKSQSSERDG
jgi:hypothetical protein